MLNIHICESADAQQRYRMMRQTSSKDTGILVIFNMCPLPVTLLVYRIQLNNFDQRMSQYNYVWFALKVVTNNCSRVSNLAIFAKGVIIITTIALHRQPCQYLRDNWQHHSHNHSLSLSMASIPRQQQTYIRCTSYEFPMY